MLTRLLFCAMQISIPARCEEDPLKTPPELIPFIHAVTAPHIETRAKLQGLLSGIFRSRELGGLGIEYDNSKTRTIQEVWQDRKANCLSLTALFVASCNKLGIEAKYAEPTNTFRWRKYGTVIHYERHLVCLIPFPPQQDLVADFLPQLRRRIGAYRVTITTETRIKSFFYSNRAVELLEEGKIDGSLAQSLLALKADATFSVGWNIHGVILRALGRHSDAEKAFKQAMALDPKDSSALANMEAVCRDQGDLAEADRYREISQDHRKKDPYFNAFLAEEAMSQGNIPEARSRVETALKIHAQEPEFHLLRARIFLMEGHTDSATKSIEQAKKCALPSERDRYDTKLNAIRKWDQDREKSDPGKG